MKQKILSPFCNKYNLISNAFPYTPLSMEMLRWLQVLLEDLVQGDEE